MNTNDPLMGKRKALYEIYMLNTKFINMVNNVYIIIDSQTRHTAVVDPAWNIGLIKDTLNKLQAEVKVILLTHSHYDHTNLVNSMLKIYPAKVYMSKTEVDYYNYKCNSLVPVQDGEVIKLGYTDIKCILTPGHTMGGMCFFVDGSLFTGDTIFMEGCGICSNLGGDAGDMFHSINRIKAEVSHDTKMYSGHTIDRQPGCTLGDLIKNNIYFSIDKKELFVQFRQRENQKRTYNFR